MLGTVMLSVHLSVGTLCVLRPVWEMCVKQWMALSMPQQPVLDQTCYGCWKHTCVTRHICVSEGCLNGRLVCVKAQACRGMWEVRVCIAPA